jgi:hypothetical protein
MAVRAGGAAGGRCRHDVHAASAHGVHMAARAPRGLVGFGFVPHLLGVPSPAPHLPLPSLLGMGGNGNCFPFSSSSSIVVSRALRISSRFNGGSATRHLRERSLTIYTQGHVIWYVFVAEKLQRV